MSMSHSEKNNEIQFHPLADTGSETSSLKEALNVHTTELTQTVFFNYWSTNLKIFDYCLLSENPNITWNIVKENHDKSWDYYFLSGNPIITWDIVKENPGIGWNYTMLSKNPNITWDIVQSNPEKEWHYSFLSGNPNITWGIVQSNPEKPWNYSILSKNHNITWDIVQSNPDKPWDYSDLSKNPNITWDIVQSNPEKPWNYSYLSQNPNITWDIVQSNPEKDWNYYFLSYNPNITWYNGVNLVKSSDQRGLLHLYTRSSYCVVFGSKFKSKNWNYNKLLSNINFFNNSYVEKIKNIISHFKTNITEELMMYVWHPSRVEKWKYLLDDEEI
jgi:hypothetical protein